MVQYSCKKKKCNFAFGGNAWENISTLTKL